MNIFALQHPVKAGQEPQGQTESLTSRNELAGPRGSSEQPEYTPIEALVPWEAAARGIYFPGQTSRDQQPGAKLAQFTPKGQLKF